MSRTTTGYSIRSFLLNPVSDDAGTNYLNAEGCRPVMVAFTLPGGVSESSASPAPEILTIPAFMAVPVMVIAGVSRGEPARSRGACEG
jgi:hypothetical protein